LGECIAHTLDLAGDAEALPVAALVVLIFVDGRLRQGDLLIEALQLGGILRGALIEQRLLKSLVALTERR
jgi:hypothetical protein